jgi:hypothetical protein
MSDPEERILENTTRLALLAYRDACLDPEWALPGYGWTRQGPDIVLTIGAERVSGRLSAWVHLAGELWATAAAPILGTRYHRLIPNFTLPGTSRWSAVAEIERPLRPLIARAAAALIEVGEKTEAVHSLRRFFGSLADRDRLSEDPDLGPLHSLREPLRRANKWSQYFPYSTGYRERFEGFAAWLSDPDPVERAEGLAQLEWWLMYHSDEDRSLHIAALVGGAIASNLSDPEPWVREAAAACASRLGMLLWEDRAHPEAIPWLEAAIAAGEGLAVNLVRLYETRRAMEDTAGAEEAWRRQEPLARLWSRQLIHANFFDQGSPEDARAAALARVARDHLRRAGDEDPCRQRPLRLGLDERQRQAHRQLAEALVDEALALLEPALPRWLAAAREREVISRRFSAEPFFLKGRLEEERGNAGEALRRYEQAQAVARSLGVSWRGADFDEDVLRVRRARDES